MRITELFTAKSIELDSAASNRDEILSRLVELQATHGNITDTEAYKKALYAREDEASTYVDNGITVPHAKTNVVTRPSLAALRLSNREIAEKLHLSEGSVKQYISQIYSKLAITGDTRLKRQRLAELINT
mgnify:CR=1 FL=1